VCVRSPNLAYNDDEIVSYDEEDDQGQQDAGGRMNPVRTGWTTEDRYTTSIVPLSTDVFVIVTEKPFSLIVRTCPRRRCFKCCCGTAVLNLGQVINTICVGDQAL